jgi:acetyl-CoA carboxylase carboxyltransferase component
MTTDYSAAIERARQGNLHKEAAKLEKQGKLFVRERIRLLVDDQSFVEDGLLANISAPTNDLPADGVVTGTALVGGRQVAIVANDPTVKAGSWGARTVEKIIRVTEMALSHQLPIFWLIDSAGARITDQVELFPGRRGAGRIFYNEVKLSGMVPQICCLFGPSAAGGAYIPAFCDVVIMVEGNASMYLGSPRMVEMVTGEVTTLEEMGGAKMHTTVSGCGDFLVKTDEEAIETAKRYFSYMPSTCESALPIAAPVDAAKVFTRAIVPESERQAYDMHKVIDTLIDAGSFMEVKKGFAKELIVGFGRLDGQVVGLVANNPMQKGGVLFIDSADKAARFIWCCDAYGIPLIFLSDVPGFMVGTAVEKQGIIRHGAKMITAVSEATVPKICVVVRKSYGAGLYAMCGPAFEPEATIALPMAKIAVMGPEPAVNAVYANKIAEIADDEERSAYVAARRAEYEEDVDLLRLASELVVDAIIEPEALRAELIARFARAVGKVRPRSVKRHAVFPV